MNEQQARGIAQQALDQSPVWAGRDVVILDDQTLEFDGYWVFVYNSRAFAETRDDDDAVLGNAPILVQKATGEARFGRTDLPIEEQV
jgi:hypothetical protein